MKYKSRKPRNLFRGFLQFKYQVYKVMFLIQL